MMDLHTKDDKEMIVKSTLQSTAVLELDQILDIQGPKIPSWENWPICAFVMPYKASMLHRILLTSIEFRTKKSISI